MLPASVEAHPSEAVHIVKRMQSSHLINNENHSAIGGDFLQLLEERWASIVVTSLRLDRFHYNGGHVMILNAQVQS